VVTGGVRFVRSALVRERVRRTEYSVVSVDTLLVGDPRTTGSPADARGVLTLPAADDLPQSGALAMPEGTA
jgi:hypothetical protein